MNKIQILAIYGKCGSRSYATYGLAPFYHRPAAAQLVVLKLAVLQDIKELQFHLLNLQIKC